MTFSHQEGIILELLGTFSIIPGYQHIILGHTSDGEGVTLYRNETIGYNLGSGFTTATYKSRFVFTGMCIDFQRDLKFRSINCRFNVLNEWLHTENLITIKHNRDHNEAILQFKPLFTKQIQLGKDLDIILSKTHIGRAERTPLKMTFEETSKLKIIFKRRIPLPHLLSTLKMFQNLLTFVAQRQVYPFDINIDFRIKGKGKINSAFLQYQIPNYQDSIKKSSKSYEFLFSYSLIPHKIDSLIHKWFELGDKLSLIMVEFCSQFYNPKMYQEDKFLSMTTCLESFHREFRVKKNLPNVNRYMDLFEEGRTAFNWLLKIPSKNKFCNDLKDFRNDLTHNNPDRVLKTKNIHRLYKLTEYTKVIVVTVILRELGLTNPEIKNLFRENQIFHIL